MERTTTPPGRRGGAARSGADAGSARRRDATSRRTILVTLFSGEESGIAGSSWLVDVLGPLVPVDHVMAMVNLDMVGQLRDETLIALGSDSAEGWKTDPGGHAATGVGIHVAAHGDGYGPSDQTSFYAKHIPVIHFFTGAHERYHTPEDQGRTR